MADDLDVHVGGDISELRQAIEAAKAEVQAFNKEVDNTGTVAESTGQQLDQLEGKYAGVAGLERARADARAKAASTPAALSFLMEPEAASGVEKLGKALGDTATQERLFEQAAQSSVRAASALGSTMLAASQGPAALARGSLHLASSLQTMSADAAIAGTTVRASLLSALTGPAGLIVGLGAVMFAIDTWGDDIAKFIRGNEEAALSVEELTAAAGRFISLEGKGPSFGIAADPAVLDKAIEAANTIRDAYASTISTLQTASGPTQLQLATGLQPGIIPSQVSDERRTELLEQAIEQVQGEDEINAAVRQRLIDLRAELEVREAIERAARAVGLQETAKEGRGFLGETFTTPAALERIGDIESARFEAPVFDSNQIARGLFFGETNDELDREMRSLLDTLERVNEVDSDALAGHATTLGEALEGVTDLYDARQDAERAQIESTRRLIEAGIYPFGDALNTVLQRLARGESVSAGEVAGSFLSSVISTGIQFGVGAIVTSLTGGNIAAGIGAGSAAGSGYQGLIQRPDTSNINVTITPRIINGTDIYMAVSETMRVNRLPTLGQQ